MKVHARSLLDTLAAAKADVRHGVPPDLLEHEKSLQHKLALVLSQKVMLESSDSTSAQREAINREIDRIVEDLQNVRVDIQKASPQYAALVNPETLTSEQIRGLLDTDTLLLEFALGDERSYLWLISDKNVTAFELKGRHEEIEDLVRKALDQITERNRSKNEKLIPRRIKQERDADRNYMALSRTLSRMLLGQVVDQLESKRLAIVADGALQHLPFGALPEPLGEDNAWEPLILRHEIVILPSASALSAVRSQIRDREPAPQLLAMLTNPTYELKGREARGRGRDKTKRDASSRTGLPLNQLSFVQREIKAIKESIERANPEAEWKIWEGPDANRTNATSDVLSKYRIVHYSTHGKLYSSRPELSGIVLSLYDRQGRPQPDFFMSLGDVYNMKLSADLVVLSACESALGKEIKGEGVIGLTRGFMYAGAGRVVSSLWEVDDFHTADLMGRFYQQMLENKLPPPAALKATQAFMWQKLKLPPYYWAAFQLQGEWRGVLRP
jgi:CHAT domain-containing protein